MPKSTRKTQQQYIAAITASTGIAARDPILRLTESWWVNSLNPQSLRLTKIGFAWFTSVAKLTSYPIELGDQKILPKQMLQLERVFNDPYYIKNLSTIVVFSETDAVMLGLHCGDLATYLNNLDSTD